MKIWNYSRTPSRGARLVELWIDDLVVYRGSLRQAGSPGAAGLVEPDSASQAILFSGDPSLIKQEAHQVYHCAAHEQEVVFINERQVMSHGGMGHLAQQGGAQPDLLKRPGTAVGSRN
jgi:hypothetical protein